MIEIFKVLKRGQNSLTGMWKWSAMKFAKSSVIVGSLKKVV